MFGRIWVKQKYPRIDGRIVPDSVRPVATERIAYELAEIVILAFACYGNPFVARLGNANLIYQPL